MFNKIKRLFYRIYYKIFPSKFAAAVCYCPVTIKGRLFPCGRCLKCQTRKMIEVQKWKEKHDRPGKQYFGVL